MVLITLLVGLVTGSQHVVGSSDEASSFGKVHSRHTTPASSLTLSPWSFGGVSCPRCFFPHPALPKPSLHLPRLLSLVHSHVRWLAVPRTAPPCTRTPLPAVPIVATSADALNTSKRDHAQAFLGFAWRRRCILYMEPLPQLPPIWSEWDVGRGGSIRLRCELLTQQLFLLLAYSAWNNFLFTRSLSFLDTSEASASYFPSILPLGWHSYPTSLPCHHFCY